MAAIPHGIRELRSSRARRAYLCQPLPFIARREAVGSQSGEREEGGEWFGRIPWPDVQKPNHNSLFKWCPWIPWAIHEILITSNICLYHQYQFKSWTPRTVWETIFNFILDEGIMVQSIILLWWALWDCVHRSISSKKFSSQNAALPIFTSFCFGWIWTLPQMPSHNRHVSTTEVEMSCVWLLDSLLSQATNYCIQRSPH